MTLFGATNAFEPKYATCPRLERLLHRRMHDRAADRFPFAHFFGFADLSGCQVFCSSPGSSDGLPARWVLSYVSRLGASDNTSDEVFRLRCACQQRDQEICDQRATRMLVEMRTEFSVITGHLDEKSAICGSDIAMAFPCGQRSQVGITVPQALAGTGRVLIASIVARIPSVYGVLCRFGSSWRKRVSSSFTGVVHR